MDESMQSRKLYLIRHAEAQAAGNDAERPLSARGQHQAQQLAQRLLQQGAKPQCVLHSGILRAQQTAQILANSLNGAVIEQTPGLLPDDAITAIIQSIESWRVDTMLVGHLPYMAELLWSLAPAAYAIQFDTATAVCLHKAGNLWVVESVLQV